MQPSFENDIEDVGKYVDVEMEHISTQIPQHMQKSNFLGEMHEKDVEEYRDTIPGTQKIFLKTFGCSHNVSDSEYMAGILQTYGYRMTADKNDADLWLVNSCTVKDPSQAAFMNLVNSGRFKYLYSFYARISPLNVHMYDFVLFQCSKRKFKTDCSGWMRESSRS